MENSYGIGVANRYALFLDDESDPLETLFQKEQEKELKKKTKVADKEIKAKLEPPKGKPALPVQKKTVKETTTAKNQENKRDGNEIKSNQKVDGKGERVAKFNNENREERNNRRNREDRPYNGPSENRENRPRRDNENFENRPRREGGVGGGERREGGGERREGRGEGRPRPGNNDRPRNNRTGTFTERRGKREFDRQSGSDKTGVKPVEKRDGAGAHNWGSTKDLIEAEAERPNETDQSWGENDKPEVNNDAEKKDEPETEQAPVEEEPKELTLDEWKAQRAGRAKPTYNIRKAGEGEDLSQWKKMFELKKKEKEEESEDEEYDASEYPQRVGRQKHVLDIDIQFNDNRRPGGTRGRGGSRGGRGGRGGAVGGPRREPREGDARGERRFRDEQVSEEIKVDEKTPRAPKVDDERDFPSLG
ncbi:plasminogen activator inhibitor 1 RNA-binding protein isoform X2 [Anthonomus grandis grandis]|uniref:plasminogen activator inhibitor 1 RNA-binding protein isoform X2 n=1 Tax=Anthonomus grandis grandis TaxID=2921223 RepID=UPI002165DC8B|nr:plasminogen activator inhibitor 1 RNA-binding protein isoform X2 [Anthonomus grandis grandis]